MDVEDFTREVKPHHRRSRLEKFKTEIRSLKRQGYSDMQVRDWLAKNGLSVSRESVRKYIARHLNEQNPAPLAENVQANESPAASEQGQSPQPAKDAADESGHNSGMKESPAARLRRLAKEQRDEAAQTQFKHDKTGNNH